MDKDQKSQGTGGGAGDGQVLKITPADIQAG
jgi:hypothetical protein